MLLFKLLALLFKGFRQLVFGCLVIIIILAFLLTCAIGAGLNQHFIKTAYAEGLIALELVPSIEAISNANQPRGLFYDETLTIAVDSTPISLASTPDGKGELCTDDRATLTISTQEGQKIWEWSHTFADNRDIVCLPPQEISTQLAPGNYRLAVQLEDLYANKYGTEPYYLILSPPVTTQANANNLLAFLSLEYRLLGGALLVGLLLLVAIVAIRRRKPPTPRLTGIVDLFNNQTKERRTELLLKYPSGAAITRHPLGLIAQNNHNTKTNDTTIALIQPSLQGPLMQEELETIPPADPILLEHGETYKIAKGTVQIRYR